MGGLPLFNFSIRYYSCPCIDTDSTKDNSGIERTHCNLFFGSAYSLRLFSSCFRLMSCWLFVVQGPFVLAWIIDLQCRSWCDEANAKKFSGWQRAIGIIIIGSHMESTAGWRPPPPPLCAVLCHFSPALHFAEMFVDLFSPAVFGCTSVSFSSAGFSHREVMRPVVVHEILLKN